MRGILRLQVIASKVLSVIIFIHVSNPQLATRLIRIKFRLGGKNRSLHAPRIEVRQIRLQLQSRSEATL